MQYLIHDKEDGTYHAGGGQWSHDRERAERYDSRKLAEAGLDDVDCDEILRDRLHIVLIDEEDI